MNFQTLSHSYIENVARTRTDWPLVAIVTPVYNGAKYLADTMECVQSQDYPNLVHVVLDNASTDATPDIIKRFAGRRVPVLTRRNPRLLPLTDNWNAAVRLVPADARYFQLLCADDTLTPNALSGRVEIAESDPEIGMVGCLWRIDGLCGEELPKGRKVFDGQDLVRSYLRREHSALSGMFFLFRTSKIDPAMPFYDEHFKPALDVNSNLRVAMTGKVGFQHEELAFWRKHDDQVSATSSERNQYVVFDWLRLLDHYGPAVMGFNDYLACRRTWRNHYLRRLLKVRFLNRDRAVWEWHIKSMKGQDDQLRLLDFAGAVLDMAWAKLTGRKGGNLTPRRPAFGAPIYYN